MSIRFSRDLRVVDECRCRFAVGTNSPRPQRDSTTMFESIPASTLQCRTPMASVNSPTTILSNVSTPTGQSQVRNECRSLDIAYQYDNSLCGRQKHYERTEQRQWRHDYVRHLPPISRPHPEKRSNTPTTSTPLPIHQNGVTTSRFHRPKATRTYNLTCLR